MWKQFLVYDHLSFFSFSLLNRLTHPAIDADKDVSLKKEFMLLDVPFIPLKSDKLEGLV